MGRGDAEGSQSLRSPTEIDGDATQGEVCRNMANTHAYAVHRLGQLAGLFL